MSPPVAAIIYFACGFPIAMYLVIHRRPTLAKMVVWSIFWPVFALVLVFRLIRPTLEMRENARRLRIERIAAEIERDAFDGGAMAEVFEFREVFYRYAGLAEAASTPPSYMTDLHERCLSRNNRKKLAFHAAEARDEFVGLASEFPARSLQDAIALADLVGDPDAKESLGGI